MPVLTTDYVILTSYLAYKGGHMNIEKWSELKNRGSKHYKSYPNAVEPIDLYAAMGIFQHFALGNIVKYALRNSTKDTYKSEDMDKVIHYAELLKAYME